MQKWLASLVEVAGCMTIFPGKVDKMVCVCIGNVVTYDRKRKTCMRFADFFARLG